jgi:hypothetical protein
MRTKISVFHPSLQITPIVLSAILRHVEQTLEKRIAFEERKGMF